MIPLPALMLLWLVLLPQIAQSPGTPPRPPAVAGSITVDVSTPGPRIPSSLYGIFFEEISHAGEGGLYAELMS